MSGKNHVPETRSDSLRKPFSIWRLIQFFKICEGGYGGRSRYPESLCPWSSSYTYIHTSLAIRNPHKERGFEKPSTRRGVSKHTYQLRNQLPSVSMRFKTPLPVRGFWRADSKPLSLWWFLLFRLFFQLSMYVCSKPLCLWGFFQNPSLCEDFFKTLLPVRGLLPEVPPLTKLKKLNRTLNTERFS